MLLKILISLGILGSFLPEYSRDSGFKLPGAFYAITPDGPQKLTVSRDTVVFSGCRYNLQCYEAFKRHFLVQRYINQGDLHILLVEQLPSPSFPWKGDKYKVLAIKELDRNGFQLVEEAVFFPAVDAIRYEEMNFYAKFSFSYHSEKRLSEMKKLKSIHGLTKEEFVQMREYMQNELSDKVAEQLRITKTGDVYGTGIAREMWNLTALKFGYSPLTEERTLNEVIKKLSEE